MAFATNTEYKASRGITSSDFDSAIAEYIAAAQNMAEEWCGYTSGGFESSEKTYNLDGTGSQTLRLPDAPIDTGSTVTVLEVADDGTTTTVSSDDYRVRPEGDIERLPFDTARGRFDGPDGWAYSPVWAEGVRNYRVTATTGWVTSGGSENRPKMLLEAIYKLVDAIGAERGSSLFRQSVAAGSENFTRRTPADELAALGNVLRPYRRSIL